LNARCHKEQRKRKKRREKSPKERRRRWRGKAARKGVLDKKECRGVECAASGFEGKSKKKKREKRREKKGSFKG